MEDLGFGQAGAAAMKDLRFGQAGTAAMEDLGFGQVGAAAMEDLGFGQVGAAAVEDLRFGQARTAAVEDLRFGQAGAAAVEDLRFGQAGAAVTYGFAFKHFKKVFSHRVFLSAGSAFKICFLRAVPRCVYTLPHHPFYSLDGLAIHFRILRLILKKIFLSADSAVNSPIASARYLAVSTLYHTTLFTFGIRDTFFAYFD